MIIRNCTRTETNDRCASHPARHCEEQLFSGDEAIPKTQGIASIFEYKNYRNDGRDDNFSALLVVLRLII
ncbi:MAG: hypothetical protein NT150_05670 [Bacteroidetes bacterium]|nr:hypothetical protein [Bacteroidota bacterium]